MKRIITFYSYKGGTGRSLLLANTAKFFAYCGYRVFVIDFDLEAPGLHYKFKVKPKKLGLIDYILGTQKRHSNSIDKFVQEIRLEKNFEGKIFLMPAGNAPSVEYADKLSQVNWDNIFYHTKESIKVPIIDSLVEKILKDYSPDFILVDSQTGLTDIGAITIRFMPNQLVCLYHNNQESKDGIDLIKKTVEESNKINDYKIDIIEVLARIPEKVKQGDIVLRPELNVKITEELKFDSEKTLRESILVGNYLNFFDRLEPDIKSKKKIKSIYEWALPDETGRRKSDQIKNADFSVYSLINRPDSEPKTMGYNAKEFKKIDITPSAIKNKSSYSSHVGSSSYEDVLVVVDVQNDFFMGGPLSVPDADSLINPLNIALKAAEKAGFRIIFTQDWHPLDHSSFVDNGGGWKPHCIIDTIGAALHAGLYRPNDADIVRLGVEPELDGYTPFENPLMDALINKPKVKRVYVTGIALEYCVYATCKHTRERDKDVIAVESLIRAASPPDAEKVWKKLMKLGVKREKYFKC